MTGLSYLGKKNRMGGDLPAYAVFKDRGWTWKVFKTWQQDDSKQYARWMCEVTSPYTMGGSDLGDVYVADIVKVAEAILVEVDGRKPTSAEVDEYLALAGALGWGKK